MTLLGVAHLGASSLLASPSPVAVVGWRCCPLCNWMAGIGMEAVVVLLRSPGSSPCRKQKVLSSPSVAEDWLAPSLTSVGCGGGALKLRRRSSTGSLPSCDLLRSTNARSRLRRLGDLDLEVLGRCRWALRAPWLRDLRSRRWLLDQRWYPEMADGASVSPFVVLCVAPTTVGVVGLVLPSKRRVVVLAGCVWPDPRLCAGLPAIVCKLGCRTLCALLRSAC